MKYVVPTLVALIVGTLGVLSMADFKGFGTRYDESVAQWWAGGPLRRSLRPRFTARTSRRYRRVTGAAAIGIAVFLLVGEILFT